jgi:methyltransferase (TIGR00027 family)
MGADPAGNIVRTGIASRTALAVATLRAVHQVLDDPLVLADPFALAILGPDRAAALRADPSAFDDPQARGLRGTVVVRSRFAEDELTRAVATGTRQYVVLGAGLDTFACRNPFVAQGLKVFEVDHPATQTWKRASLQSAGIAEPGSLTFVPVDFERQRLAEALAQAGLDLSRPACFAWLGVTMYLSGAAVMDVLGFVARLPQGSAIVCDFRIPRDMQGPAERARGDNLAARVAERGEPWISAFAPADLRAKARALGFGDVETCEPEDLNRLYMAGRQDGLRTGGRLLRAVV